MGAAATKRTTPQKTMEPVEQPRRPDTNTFLFQLPQTYQQQPQTQETTPKSPPSFLFTLPTETSNDNPPVNVVVEVEPEVTGTESSSEEDNQIIIPSPFGEILPEGVGPTRELGQLQFRKPTSQTCLLFQLTQDLLKELVTKYLVPTPNEVQEEDLDIPLPFSAPRLRRTPKSSDPGLALMQTCKTAYKYLAPFWKWKKNPIFDAEGLVGFYHYTQHSQKTEDIFGDCNPFTLGVVLRKDATFEGKLLLYNSGTKDVKGTYSVHRDGTIRFHERIALLPFADPQQGYSTLRAPSYPAWTNFKTYNMTFKSEKEFLAYSFLKPSLMPRMRPIMKCGVPLEEQNQDADCCLEVVSDLVNSVWDASSVSFDCKVKQEIIERVSRLCAQPPGMTDTQLRIRIAEEISLRAEWNETFASVGEICSQ